MTNVAAVLCHHINNCSVEILDAIAAKIALLPAGLTLDLCTALDRETVRCRKLGYRASAERINSVVETVTDLLEAAAKDRKPSRKVRAKR